VEIRFFVAKESWDKKNLENFGFASDFADFTLPSNFQDP
jgi:hypothetical protein